MSARQPTRSTCGAHPTAPLRRPLLATALFSLLVAAPPLAARQPTAPLRTAPERTNHEQTTRYAEVVAFMETAAARSPHIHLTTFGYTMEGRPLPLAVVGRVASADPAAVLASGRTRVYLQGNIHAGEVEGKEALLMLLRDIADGRHGAWLDSLVLLVAPIYNADGNERVRLTNRPAQHGPIGGMGQRPNAQDLDLNRDHMKLDSPEARSLARLLQRYDPHVGVDLHTTNGTRHAYHLTYSPPLHPSTDSAIVAFLRTAWLPAVTRAIRTKYGWDFYYYGNAQGQGEARGWYTFDHRPRFNNNYLGLRNRFAILSEAYSYLTFEDRIRATSRFVEEILDFAAAHATPIREHVARADAAPVAGRAFAVRAEFERSGPVDILMGAVVEERNPFTGAVMLRRADVSRPERMWEYGTFRPTEFERAPAAYLLPAGLGDIVDRLHAHGVRTTVLPEDRTLSLERFRIDSTTVSPREFQGRRERTVFGAWEPATLRVPAGTHVLAMDQPLARLAFHLLEPRADDGFHNWALFDPALEGASHAPVLRAPEWAGVRRD
jgi:hypothetical protein